MRSNSPLPLVVGLGEVLWDLLPTGRQLGGAPANFAYHAAALGAQGVVVSQVGDDSLGREALERLAALKLNFSFVSVDSRFPTGTVNVRLDEKGKPDYVIRENVAWDFLPDSPSLRRLAARADAVCFGTLAQRSAASRASIETFLGATGASCLRVFDINLRQNYFTQSVIRDSLARSTVLKLNDDELPVVAALLRGKPEGLAGAEALMREFADLQLVAVTHGEHGATLHTREGSFSHPGFAAHVADTVGAGDAFTAALVMGLLTGQAPAQIVMRANRLASYVCSRSGATPRIPADLIALVRGKGEEA